jgi:hypothetical protein
MNAATTGQGSALAGRLVGARRRGFVGRTAERDLLAAALSGEPDDLAVLFLHGPGGIGKSALLRTMAADAEAAGLVTVPVDGREVAGTPAAFLSAASQALGLPPDADPLSALHGGPRPLLLVDTFERSTGLQAWLRERFLPRLPEGAVTVIAGRDPPDEAWRLDPGWHQLVRTVALRNLPPAEARTLLAARGVPDRLHERILAFAGGHPLALALVAEVVAQAGSDDVVPDSPDVVGVLLARFVDEAPSARHRAALEVCAHTRVTTASMLHAALGGPGTDELFDWLSARSFVERGTNGLHPHDLAREVLDGDLRWRAPDRYLAMHRRVREYLIERIVATHGADRARAWQDLMYLHRRNPLFAPFITFGAGGREYEDVLQPGDHAAVRSMTSATEGPESARIVDFWLRRRPAAFRVYRRGGQADPAGFSAWLSLGEPDPEEIAADPVVAAAWAFAGSHGPPRPGTHIGLLRWCVDPTAYHRPSRVMDLVQIRCGVEWSADPPPSWSFLVIADPDFWGPQMAYLDQVRATEATVGGRRYCLFGHDWRAVPLAAWFEVMGDRELAADLDPQALAARREPQRAVLSAEEFEAAVRSALRVWGHRDALARNALCRSRLVADAGGEPADTLAELLVTAADSLAEDPRDRKLHRAVAATFFRRAPTQEAAAERLGLPFSTYRRHLATGIARVVEWLWERELHGPSGSG